MSIIQPSDRASAIKPFKVMEILRAARELEEKGFDVIHFEVGEPDFATAPQIINAGKQALERGHTGYTQALGLPDLRARISEYYKCRFGVHVSANRIGVCSGASAGLNLIFTSLVNAGDGVLMTDPGYPCNETFVQTAGGLPQKIPVGQKNGFQMSAAAVNHYWTQQTVGLLLSSPSNPTGTIIERNEFESITNYVDQKKGFLVIDEIYQGIVFDDMPSSQLAGTALEIDPSVIVVNSFSKYFGMTGWRLGWFVVPESLIEIIERIAQNLYISPSSVAQYAALEAFDASVLEVFEGRRLIFQKRRDLMVSSLAATKLSIAQIPHGAFYIYVDISMTGLASDEFCKILLTEEKVAVTPGSDFGEYDKDRYVRFAFTTGENQIREGMKRVARLVNNLDVHAI